MLAVFQILRRLPRMGVNRGPGVLQITAHLAEMEHLLFPGTLLGSEWGCSYGQNY